MSDEKETIFKNCCGNWRDGWIMCGWLLVILTVILLLFIFISIIFIPADYYEVKAFNRIHETDYTFGEWFWAEGTIKDYHLGTVENKNYAIDLNVKGLELKGGEIENND